jgi:hypothetical protein
MKQPGKTADEEVNVWRRIEWAALSVPVIATFLSLMGLSRYWDDGAITAAFARTYAATGRYAMTAGSVEVEGFSSLLWMHLLQAPFHMLTPTAAAVLIWMKLLSVLSFMATLVALRGWLRAVRVHEDVRGGTLLLVACLSTPIMETLNGMEMNLYTLLAVGLAWALWVNARFSIVLLTLALLGCRFEGGFMVLALAVACVAARRSKSAVLWMLGAACLSFGALEAWRFVHFGLWMPNTVYAKRWPPYTTPGIRAFLRSRLKAEAEILMPLGAMVLMAWFVKGKPDGKDPFVRFTVCLSGAAVVFQALLGENWGHSGRMIEPELCFFEILICLWLFRGPLMARSKRAFSYVLLFQCCCTCAYGYYRIRLHPLIPVQVPYETGTLVEGLRLRLNQTSMTFMTPDVGGAALCCERLKIVDSGMLANPELALAGWKDFPRMLRDTHPDVILTHSIWSADSKIYDSLGGYQPALIHGERLFLRDDVARSLLGQGAALVPLASNPLCAGDDPVDRAGSIRWTNCVVVGP